MFSIINPAWHPRCSLSIISSNVANSNSMSLKTLASFADLGAGRSAETLASKASGQGV